MVLWILMVVDDEGAFADVFSTRAKATASLLQQLAGPLYWKTSRAGWHTIWEAGRDEEYHLYASVCDAPILV